MARADEPFDVPVEPLGGGRGQARRAQAVAVALVVVVGSAFAIARLSDRGAGAPKASPPARSDAARTDATASPSATPVGSPRTEPRVERLIDASDRALPGAPRIQLVEAHDRDLTLVTWIAGEGLQRGRTFPNALPGGSTIAFPVVAPTGDRVVLLRPEGPGPPRAKASLADATGRTIWEAPGIVADSGVLWSTDGSMLVTVGENRHWQIVTIGADGVATEIDVRLPGEVFLPSPVFGSLSTPPEEPRTVALGFSADGRWIYGGIVSPQIGTLIGGFRLRIDGSEPEHVLTFRVGQPDGLRPEPGTFGGRLVDPLHGRLANWRSNIDTAGGPPTVEVRDADSSLLFTVPAATPLGSGWDADGNLYLFSADSPLYMNRIALERIGQLGKPSATLLEGGPIFSASLLGVRDGFAAIALLAGAPPGPSQLVLVDLAQPARIAAIPITIAPDPAILGADLVPGDVTAPGTGRQIDPP